MPSLSCRDLSLPVTAPQEPQDPEWSPGIRWLFWAQAP